MDKEILNLDEAAELFGVSIKTFIKLLKEEKVPDRKIGREWRFSQAALIEWLSAGDSQIYSSSEVETKAFFNSETLNWDELRKKYFDDSIIKKLLNLNFLTKNMTILDIGAGNGYISIPLSNKVNNVISVDISESMLKQLDVKIKADNISNIKLIESDGLNIPLKSDSIDFICAVFYLHHVEIISAAIDEIFRLLKKGGYLFIADFYEYNNEKFLNEMHDYWPGFDEKKLKISLNERFKSIKLEELCKLKKEDIRVFTLTAKKV
jgi:excisionase family DNA binding protein